MAASRRLIKELVRLERAERSRLDDERGRLTIDQWPKVIAFVGAMGAGKDTAGGLLSEHYSLYKFAAKLRGAASIILALPAALTISDAHKKAQVPADPISRETLDDRIREAIKYVCGAANPPTNNVVNHFRTALLKEATLLPHRGAGDAGGDMYSLAPMTVGRALQIIGTECFRDCCGADVFVDAMMRDWVAAGRPHCVITDARFPNEFAAVRAAGGIIIRITRDASGGALRVDGRSAAHASEQGLVGLQPDFQIENDGTIDDLAAMIDELWLDICNRATAIRQAMRRIKENKKKHQQCELQPASLPAIANAAVHATTTTEASKPLALERKIQDSDDSEVAVETKHDAVASNQEDSRANEARVVPAQYCRLGMPTDLYPRGDRYIAVPEIPGESVEQQYKRLLAARDADVAAQAAYLAAAAASEPAL
jgi:hypothetical protein